ncbi:hypothetical protein THIOM_005421 [Candidatus Thiomargarita nelsonii]|uniref:Uncharacterized protein n=1 Tax=Candidatus Thiomargarita nelsonii TaxID=1003181 RepID=A0A176RTB5_9GAMM|nr:hypothetical protein THIOM_005421 [Candidatus Thiomargarita nelsonii]
MKTLEKKGVMPQRHFNNAEEFKQEFNDISELLIDATERPIQRPMKEPEQTEYYSGYKIIQSKILSLGHRTQVFYI